LANRSDLNRWSVSGPTWVWSRTVSLFPVTPPQDEVSCDVPHLGNVCVGRDVIAIGQHKTRQGIWMLFQNGAEIREFHGPSIFLFRNTVKRPGATSLPLLGRDGPQGRGHRSAEKACRVPHPSRIKGRAPACCSRIRGESACRPGPAFVPVGSAAAPESSRFWF
jgi:hypothetical protein